MSQAMKCSVIICAHNPRDNYLRRVLEALCTQTLPLNQWELLLIDNASEKPLAGHYDLSWHPHARHVREEKVGLTHARHRGIAESRGDFLVFVDDDNVLKPDYLEAGVVIGNNYPWLGAWGGSSFPEFDVPPSAKVKPWLGYLSLHTISTPVWAKLRVYSDACPCGAGMVVRRNLALHYLETSSQSPLRQQLDRSGTSLSSCGDIDLALSGFELDLGVGRFPQLQLTHLIPPRRLTLDYLAQLVESFGYAEVVLGVVHQPGYQAPIQKQRRIWATTLLLLFQNRATRRILLASAHGKLRAYLELKKQGHFKS